MKKGTTLFILWAFVFAFGIQAQNNIEDNLDNLYLNGDAQTPADAQSAGSSDIAKWDFFGYVESENVLAVSGKSAIKNKEIAKTEIRTRLNFRYGTTFFYTTGTVDAFFYPIEPLFMNPYSDTNVTFRAREIYVAGGEKFQFKLGKIAYNWGEADAFRITNFLDKSDSSEIFFKDEDERYTGVYSLSLKYIFGDFAAELAATPDFLIPELPKPNGFWAMNMGTISMPASPPAPPGTPPFDLPVGLQTPPNLFSSLSYKNISAAFRIGGTAKSVDFHFSYLNGYHNGMIMIPQIFFAGGMPNKIELSPLYERINKIGFDMAAAHKRFSMRFETVLTPDYVAMYKGEDSSVFDSEFRKKTERVPYWAFTLGGDYGWRDYGRIAAEYTTGFYLKNASRYEKEFFTDFLLLSLEDRVAKNRLLLRVGVILHTTDKKPGVMPLAHVEYFFDSGLALALGTNIFIGQNDTLLRLYEAHDLVYLKARYNF